MRNLKILMSLLIFMACAPWAPGLAQYKSVSFDYEKSSFNNGEPLPAETYFELQGDIPPQVGLVEVRLYPAHGYGQKEPLHRAQWKRPFNNPAQRFQLPVNFNLRSNDQYDVAVGYYREATPQQKALAQRELQAALDAYIDQNVSFDRKRIRLGKQGSAMVSDMDEIVTRGLRLYRSGIAQSWEGFSELVEEQINRISDSKQNRFLGRKASAEKNLAQKEKLVNDLKTLVGSELSYVFNAPLYMLSDQKVVMAYRTEEKPRNFTLHAGYGGAYFEPTGDINTFGRGFQAGITLPLGREPFASPFWSRTSLMAGIFFNNFELNEDLESTGPLLGRPYYLGVGFRFYRFLRLSAGTSLLQDRAREGSGVKASDQLYLRPYIGLTADIDLMIGLAK